MSVKRIKVMVETVMEDGGRSILSFDMDPFRFEMSQDREVRPVYDGSDLKNFGKPVRMEVDRRGTHLLINGFVKVEKKGEEVAMKFQTPEGGCMWPHHVDRPIFVYDRDSFEKYKSGEFKVPTHCICGVELSYDKPVCVALVENDTLNGEMLLTVEIPLTYVQLNLGDEVGKTEDELSTYEIDERVAKKLNAQADIRDQIDREQGAKFVAAVEEAIKGDQE